MDPANLLQKGLEFSENPVQGAVCGALGGAALGTMFTATSLHAAGVTVGGVVITAKTFGVIATASALGSIAAPVVLPAAGMFALWGTIHGYKNWNKRRW